MVVERHVHEGVVSEPEDDVAHGVGSCRGELVEDRLDPPLVLVAGLRGLHRISGYQALVHETPVLLDCRALDGSLGTQGTVRGMAVAGRGGRARPSSTCSR